MNPTRTTIRRIIPVLVMALLAPISLAALTPFTDYGSAAQKEWLSTGQDIWEGRYEQGPWTWFPSDNAPLPYWDENARVSFEIVSVNVTPEDDMVVRLTQTSTVTMTAHEPGTKAIIGTMQMTGQAEILFDLNADRAIVDEGHGVILLKYWNEDPMPGQLVEATGVWAGFELVDVVSHTRGWSFRPLMEGLDLQTNILQAPTIGGFQEVVTTGSYVPEPGTLLILGTGGLLLLRSRRG